MAENGKDETSGNSQTTEESNRPRSARYAANGIRNGNDFASLMSALMSDLIEGRVSPGVGNATCNAGGKLLKVVEMQYKYGTNGPGTGRRTLELTIDDAEPELLPEAAAAAHG